MKKIGLVDIDTSHPTAFLPVLRSLEYEISGIFDSGAVHPPEVVAAFGVKHGLPVLGSAEELADQSDAVIVHSANWDVHLGHAQFFVDRGCGVFVDKPFAGNGRDLQAFLELAARGRITGGSCMVFTDEVEALKRSDPSPHTVITGCGVDSFNYAVHAFAAAIGVLGYGVQRVRFNAEGRLNSAVMEWSEGRTATAFFGEHSWLPSFVTAVTAKGVHQSVVPAANLYRPLLTRCFGFLLRDEPDPHGGARQMIEPELACLAAHYSRDQGNRWVTIEEIFGADIALDGQSFVERYRRSRYPALT